MLVGASPRQHRSSLSAQPYNSNVRGRIWAAAALLTVWATTPFVSAQQEPENRQRGGRSSSIRTIDGHSVLDGFWTNGTATPLERPAEFAHRFSLTEAEALEYEKYGLARLLKQLPESEIVTSGDLNDAYLDTSSMKLAG